MITRTKHLTLPDTYPLERIGRLEELLFFDIETTGLSADYTHVYLIGCTYWNGEGWDLIQWFADTADSEAELLHSFFAFLKHYKILLHFNGDGFDIPYLLKRCAHLHLPFDFSAVTSVDIYKRIKPYKKLLGLESLRQKSIEAFLGVTRTDQYNGGQLIEVYQNYLVSHADSLYDLLILHNEDDLKGMPSILPILNYSDLLEHPLTLIRQQILEGTDSAGTIRHILELVCEGEATIPVPFTAATPPVLCEATGNRLTFAVELYDGTLKRFYPDYKNYCYLIAEDTAVHKSVAESLPKSARTRATAKTCYTKISGCFVPQFESIWEPALREQLKDKLSYAALSDVCLADPACFQAYLRQLLRHLGVR
ncbi:MAG: ribonuclease H-like domain-containing protein [Clostridiales bacterium]|nr:ribonuclease H-like domain-containing protein [Clostridiales bacterium]